MNTLFGSGGVGGAGWFGCSRDRNGATLENIMKVVTRVVLLTQ